MFMHIRVRRKSISISKHYLQRVSFRDHELKRESIEVVI